VIFSRQRHAAAQDERSHARAFRRDVRRAFGIEAWDATKGEFVPVREPTARERELFEPGDYTLPVDWHSWRRAYSQALADAGATAQQASALAGHASLSAHARYLAKAGTARQLPVSRKDRGSQPRGSACHID
jgi:hypothetical protein